jgi:hypothetical protein
MSDEHALMTAEEAGEIASSATEDRRALAVIGGYDPDLDFEKLAQEAQYYSRGFRLVKKEALLGIPHIIISAIWREGFERNGRPGDYVSVEAVVGSTAVLDSGPARAMREHRELAVYGNEAVVYNDSGTGIRRALTDTFAREGMIDVGSQGGPGENVYDRPYQEWAAGADLATQGITTDRQGRPFRFAALRGLRVSDYDYKGKPARTWYFA